MGVSECVYVTFCYGNVVGTIEEHDDDQLWDSGVAFVLTDPNMDSIILYIYLFMFKQIDMCTNNHGIRDINSPQGCRL